LIFLAFLFPVALYVLGLALVNRARHPVIISGPWDFAGVLFAASGFLLLGGPVVLSGFYHEWRLAWLLGQGRFLQSATWAWSFWISVWLLYFAGIVGGSALLLRRRRHVTSIYNVEPAVCEGLLAGTFDRLGLEVRSGGAQRLLLSARPSRESAEIGAYEASNVGLGSPESASSRQSASLPDRLEAEPTSWIEVRVDPSPSMYHVALHWKGPVGVLREEVEGELARACASTVTMGNPIAGFLMSLSTGLFFVIFAAALFLLILRLFNLPR
jgi:hypothetical protein